MGADSSTLSHIESLNSTLSELEKKMFYMEDFVLHHERTIAKDNVVMIAEKMIQGRVGVNLTVGPVIGTIGSDFVRVMVEVDRDTVLTFNVFERSFDDQLIYLYSTELTACKGVPVARTLPSLRSNTEYCVYLGGIDCSHIITTCACFCTLSKTLQRPRFLFLHNTRVDKTISSNFSLWNDVFDIFPTVADSKPSAEVNQLPINFIVHLGNLVSVEPIFKDKTLGILDLLLREDVDSVRVMEQFNEMENSIRQLYREAFATEPIRKLTRRCGWFFLAGDGEAAHAFSSTFAVQIEKVVEDTAKKPTTDGTDDPEAAAAAAAAVAAATPEDPMAASTSVVKEMKYLLLGVFIRMARRVSWCYMRQLWDDQYDNLKQCDDEREFYYRSILLQRKLIIAKTHLRSLLNATVIRSVKEFGTEYKASNKLTERLVQADNELIELNQNLRTFAMKSSELNSKLEVVPNGVCLALGSLCVVVMESAWGNLAPDGQVLADFGTSVEISQKIFDSVEEKLALEGVFAVVCLSACPLTPVESQLEVKAYLNESLSYRMLDRNEAPVYRFAPVDVKRLLKSFVTWQQSTQNHTVLLVEPNSKYSAKGCINALNVEGGSSDRYALTQIQVGRMIPSADFVQWFNFDSSLLDSLDAAAAATGENRTYLYSPFLSVVDRASRCSSQSFWDVVLVPAEKPSQSETSRTGWVAGQPATCTAKCITASGGGGARYSLSMGPIVGLVTATAAVVLLEASDSVQLELLCLDQISGEEHMCVRLAAAHRPCCFYFSTLRPNRAYDIVLPSYARRRLGTFATHLNGATGSEHKAPDVFRLQILGGGPSHSGISASDGTDRSRALLDPQAQQLSRLAQEAEMVNMVSGMLAASWNGVDVTVHCGSHVDVSSAVESALSLLTEAENQILGMRASEQTTRQYVQKAKECLHRSYTLYWGDKISKLLSRGSHKLLTNPVLELLNVLQASTLTTTRKDLTPFCIEHLTALFTELHHEYQAMPWSNEVIHAPHSPSHSSHSVYSRMNYIHHLAGDRVVLFELQPSLTHCFRASAGQDLLRGEQLYQLSVLLSTFGRDAFHESVSTLVLLSPLPLLIEDDNEFSSATIRYSRTETMHLLDCVCAWREVNPVGRNVIIVSSGTSRGFTGAIEVRPNTNSTVVTTNHDSSGAASSSNNQNEDQSVATPNTPNTQTRSKASKSTHTPASSGYVVHQYCCGSTVVPEGAVTSSCKIYATSQRVFTHAIAFHPSNPTHTMLEIPISSIGATGSAIKLVDKFQERVNNVSGFPVINSPRLHESEILNEVTGKLKALLGPLLVSSNIEELGPDTIVQDIHKTLVFIKGQVGSVLDQAHAVFKAKRNFYFPLVAHCDVEECLAQVLGWFSEHLSGDFQKICRNPSGFAARCVWDHLLFLECEKSHINKHSSGIQLLADRLAADKEYFGKFVFACIEVQILCEYFYSSEYLNKV